MAPDATQIVLNSGKMFEIINTAQTKETGLINKIILNAVSEKVGKPHLSPEVTGLGRSVDLTV